MDYLSVLKAAEKLTESEQIILIRSLEIMKTKMGTNGAVAKAIKKFGSSTDPRLHDVLWSDVIDYWEEQRITGEQADRIAAAIAVFIKHTNHEFARLGKQS